jgi:hypothetical protein
VTRPRRRQAQALEFVRPNEAPIWGSAYAAALLLNRGLEADERREDAAIEADLAVEIFRRRNAT